MIDNLDLFFFRPIDCGEIGQYLKLKPAVPPGGRFDLRWEKVTVRQCLQHTGGWDRDKKGGFDPIGIPRRITRALQLEGPPAPDDVVRYMMGRPLDFDPGTRVAYSNIGYLVLGRVIEAVTGQRYEPWVTTNVLHPVGAGGMLLARGVPEKRPAAEVRYYDSRGATGVILLLVPVFYSISVLDLKIIQWEPAKHQ